MKLLTVFAHPASKSFWSPNDPGRHAGAYAVRESLLGEAGGPLRRFALKRLIGDRDARGIIRVLRERDRPKDVLVQQQKVARAEALAFVAPGPPVLTAR